jgi:hypothetical protein
MIGAVLEGGDKRLAGAQQVAHITQISVPKFHCREISPL